MKTFHKLNALLAVWLGLIAGPRPASAQDLAPAAVTGLRLAATVTSGSAPFAAGGSYQLFTAAGGTNYAVLGQAGGGFTRGTYLYTKTSPIAGTLSFLDAQAGPDIALALAFISATNGTFTLTGPAGAQSGMFTTTNYFAVNPPDLFLPSLTNGQFQSYLSGQDGLVYAVETSSNLTTWSAWSNVAIADLTTNLSDPAGSGSRFFRARIQATAFAPDVLTNKTFNQTITGGVLPLPTNGISQWMADASGNSYQINGGPGTTNSSGTYSYTKTGPNSGVIAYADSLAGSVSEQLVFTAPDAGYFYATNTSGVERGTFAMADGASLFLGNVQFMPDTARSGELYFPADGTTASLSVTNATGWIWTLSFPTDALLTPQVITMTPFANVDSSDALLPVSAGVQLEPDGLQFCDGVTLTATPPAPLGTNASLVMAGDDGSDLRLVATTSQAGSYSTVLFHFTSGGATDPSSPEVQILQASAQKIYDQARNDVLALTTAALEGSAASPPPPPDYEWSCQDNQADSAMGDYVFEVFAREQGAIDRLESAAQSLSDIGGNPGDDMTLKRNLVESAMYRKVDFLLDHFSDNPKKFVAVATCAQHALGMDSSYGGAGERADWQSEFVSWGQDVLDYYFAKLDQEHDYTMVTVLPEVQTAIEQTTADTDETQFWADFNRAMTFTLTMDIALDATFTDGSGSAHVEASGDVTITGDPHTVFPLAGSDTINFQPSYDGGATLVPGQSFPENVQADNFDACQNMTVTISVDRLGADTETYTLDGYDFSELPLLKSTADVVFANKLDGGGLYDFSVPLQNKNAQAVNKTIIGHGNDGGTVTLKLTLTHTPQ